MAIEPVNGVALMSGMTEVQSSQNVNQVDFFNFLQDVNHSLTNSDVMIQQAALGESIPAHDLMLSIEQAKFNLELTIELRNRLVESYQEVMRMQV